MYNICIIDTQMRHASYIDIYYVFNYLYAYGRGTKAWGIFDIPIPRIQTFVSLSLPWAIYSLHLHINI